MTRTNDTPMRDASRDGSGGCLVCGKALPSRRARYCSRAHQQHAFRLRHQSGLPNLHHLRQELQRSRAVNVHRNAVAGLVRLQGLAEDMDGLFDGAGGRRRSRGEG